MRLLFLILILAEGTALAGIRIRARENYERIRVEPADGAGAAVYQGFSNTFNVWYEEPFSWSLGLALGPILARFRSDDHPARSGDEIRMLNYGFEVKFFPLAPSGLFLRGGGFRHFIDYQGPAGHQQGNGLYAGSGYEFRVGGLGIAPELAGRRVRLANGDHLTVLMLAVGVHFYAWL